MAQSSVKGVTKMTQPMLREIRVEAATPAAVAPFGQLLGVNETTNWAAHGFSLLSTQCGMQHLRPNQPPNA